MLRVHGEPLVRHPAALRSPIELRSALLGKAGGSGPCGRLYPSPGPWCQEMRISYEVLVGGEPERKP